MNIKDYTLCVKLYTHIDKTKYLVLTRKEFLDLSSLPKPFYSWDFCSPDGSLLYTRYNFGFGDWLKPIREHMRYLILQRKFCLYEDK